MIVSLLADVLIRRGPGFGTGRMLLAAVGCTTILLGLLPPAKTLFWLIPRVALSLISTLAVLLVCEAVFRLVHFDFKKEQEIFQTLPICYRQPIVPVGSIFFRRPGPDEWRGQVVAGWMRYDGWPERLIPDEPDVTITYDSDGFRNPESLTDWDIVVVGDSFVELGYLPYDDLYTTRLGELLHRHVKNLGVAYTGPLSHIFYLCEYGKSHSAAVAVLIFFEGNDIADLEREHAMRQEYEAAGKRIHFREFQTETSLVRSLTYGPWVQARAGRATDGWFTDTDTPLLIHYAPPVAAQLSDRQRELLESAVAQWGEAARSLGMRPWLAFMPCKLHALYGHLRFADDVSRDMIEFRPTDLPEHMAGLCRKNEIGFVDLTPPLARAADRGELPYNTIDSHLNRAGSHIVADALAEALKQDIDASSTP